MNNLQRFEVLAADRLNDIADHLPTGMEMALVAYNASNPEADIVMASGRLEDVRAAIDRRIAAAPAPAKVK